jgi:DNA-binding response OmpR family regulator
MKDPPKHDATQPLKGARVLVVEDDFLILTELEQVLSEAGAEVAGLCRTVEEALDLAKGDNLSAAILDIMLGRESVAPVARELDDGGIPFVFYSGQAETDPIRREWPGCKIFSKPARPQAIVNALADLVKR